jgi:hypothetical protein
MITTGAASTLSPEKTGEKLDMMQFLYPDNRIRIVVAYYTVY